jgi:cystathionine beta-lyase/cystathionine gamma-synthase
LPGISGPLSVLSGDEDPGLGRADVMYVETLSNPMLRLADIEKVAVCARRAGARLVVDDTFTTPINVKPLALGADLVVSSATKYLIGHSDVVAGAVAGAAGLIEPVRDIVSVTGCSADQLELVAYPLLDGHPGHQAACRELAGGGDIVTVRVAGGDEAAHQVQRELRLIQPATSLGGTESMVCIAADTSHLTLTDDERYKLGIWPGTLRLSFGLEDPDDLLSDLVQALEPVRSRIQEGSAGSGAR